MTTPTPLPLDAYFGPLGAQSRLTALRDSLKDKLGPVGLATLNESVDALKTLAARVAELEAANVAATMAYADARVQAGENAATANALRDALAEWDAAYRAANFDTTEWCGRLALAMEAARTALAAHPAASLAAHDAEVLERARVALNDADADCECGNISAITTDNVIRALAAQAATHSVPGGTSEVKP